LLRQIEVFNVGEVDVFGQVLVLSKEKVEIQLLELQRILLIEFKVHFLVENP